MKKELFIRFFTLILLLLSVNALARKPDTLSAACRVTEPREGDVITGNTIKLSAIADDTSGEIKNFRFFVEYVGVADIKEKDVYGYKFGWRQESIPSITSESPYEAVWDCSNIPDQDLWRMNFWVEYTDENGNFRTSGEVSIEADGSVAKEGEIGLVVLDRVKELKTETYHAHYRSDRIDLDGDLKDWMRIKKDSIEFKNSRNRIKLYSCWDQEFLYFGIFMNDKSVISETGEGWEPWVNDGIELFLDMKHDHNSFRKRDDKQFIIEPGGVGWQVHFDLSDSIKQRNEVLTNDIFMVRLMGTLNDVSDVDTGYSIELRIPWERLDVKPENGFSMGFDLFNTNQEIIKGGRTYLSWAGNERSNNNNPSEWGNLVLVRENRKYPVILGIMVIALIGIAVFVYVRKKSKKTEDVTLPSQKEVHIKRVREYLDEHFQKENLSLSKVADEIGISKNYLSSMFKEVMDDSFSSYLNKIRIDKAKEILQGDPGKSVTQAAYDVGYGTLDHFIRTFKSYTGMTPSEFKKSLFK